MRNRRSQKSALKWLILIGLVWAQIGYASHQLGHDIDELGEFCQICTGYDQFEKSLSDSLYTGPVPAGVNCLPIYFNGRKATDDLKVFSARASP